jgi:hypothetical protein
MSCLVKLAKAVSDTALKLALVFGAVAINKFALPVRVVVVPLAVVLKSFILVNVKA